MCRELTAEDGTGRSNPRETEDQGGQTEDSLASEARGDGDARLQRTTLAWTPLQA